MNKKQRLRQLFSFDISLLLITIILLAVGLWNLFSATSGNHFFFKQIYFILFGLSLCLGITFFGNSKVWERYAYHIYFVFVLLLLTVLLYGKIAGGSQRWINLGLFHFQPSELAKLAIILAISKYIYKDKNLFPYTLADLFRPMMMVGLLFVLIAVQPDLGTAGVVVLIAASQLAMTKLNRKTVITSALVLLILSPLGWFFGLKDYQKSRVKSFLSPASDLKGVGYHSNQSMIAIGSGKFYGQGFKKGTQTHLQFLPERHTDFIFSVLAEERGFVGSTIVLLLFLLMLISCLVIAFRTKDLFSFYVVTGITAMFFWHILINIAMVIGLFPIVGVTLPSFSYGGSAMIAYLIGIGMVLNLSKRIHYP